MKLEFINDEKINTYKVTYNNQKIKEIKKDLKKYSTKLEMKIRYDCTVFNLDSYINQYISCNEYRRLKKYNREIVDDTNDIMETAFGGACYIQEKIEITRYPLLFNILFKKHKSNNKNILKTILLYLNDEEGIKTGEKFYMSKILNIKNYDDNIPISEKIKFIEKIMNAMDFKLEKSESLIDIEKQIKIISQLTIENKNNILKKVNKRLEHAKDNSNNLEQILNYINYSNNNNYLKEKKLTK